MTLPEVAKLFRVSESTIYHWARDGKIPAYKAGRQWRFRRPDVMKRLEWVPS